MSTPDIIAIAILVLCILAGMCGLFRWIWGGIMGLLVGLTILVSLSYAASQPWSGKPGQFIQDSKLLQELAHHVSPVRKCQTNPPEQPIDE